MLSPNDLVKEVAKLLEEDKVCYVVRETREILSFERTALKTPEIIAEVNQLEKYISRYIKIIPPSTKKLLLFMEDFIPEVDDQSLQKEFKLALSRKNPTRNFLQVATGSFGIKLHWSSYSKEQYIAYVEEAFIKDYNY